MEAPFELIATLRSTDAEAGERAARALRKLAERDPASLALWRKDLLKLTMNAQDLRLRWNLIVMPGKLPLSPSQRATAVDWLFERLEDASPFTRTFALQALFDLSSTDSSLRARLLPIAQRFALQGTAAMRARARKLLYGHVLPDGPAARGGSAGRRHKSVPTSGRTSEVTE